jgi:hypothetical protein
MDDAKFDRLARALSTIQTRRRAMAIFGAAAGVMGHRVARAAQLVPATCGEQGAVCTLVSGCCDGLTCVTSAINTSYGICVPGEGGMVSTGTTLISPFSETAVEEVTALMQTTDSNAPTTDPRADRDARLADIKARKDARRSSQRTRLATRRSARKLRRTNDNPAPHLKLELQFSEVDSNPIEVVRVTNRDDFNVVLTRIETIQGSIDGVDLLPPSQFTFAPGESYSFVSGLTPQDPASDQLRWKNDLVCDDAEVGQGYRVKAAFSPDTTNYEFTVRCDKARAATAADTSSKKSSGKRKRNNRQPKKKKR